MTVSCERRSLLWAAVSITTGAGFDGCGALPQRAKHHLWDGRGAGVASARLARPRQCFEGG
jgi:hypothetical protein